MAITRIMSIHDAAIVTERSLQATLTPGHVNQFASDRSIVAGHHETDIGTRLTTSSSLLPDHHVVGRCAHGVRGQAERAGGVALRVCIDNKHRQTTHCQASRLTAEVVSSRYLRWRLQ